MGNGNMKFRIEIDKLDKDQLQLGCFLNKNVQTIENLSTGLIEKEVERYLYICLLKITISIGWFW